jgi:hypothetical protein
MSTARCYTIARLLEPDLLDMPRRTFFTLRKAGQLPFLEELKPRLGRRIRYRADLVDRWLAGEWGRSRAFASARRALAS